MINGKSFEAMASGNVNPEFNKSEKVEQKEKLDSRMAIDSSIEELFNKLNQNF